MASEWYVRVGNAERGPVAPETLRDLAQQGKITPDMLVKKGATGPWFPASRVKGLFAATASGAATTPATTPATTTAAKPAAPARPPERRPPPERQPDSGAEPKRAAPAAAPAPAVVAPVHTEHHAPPPTSLGALFRLSGMALAIVGVFVVFVAVVIFRGYFSHPADTLVGKWEMVGKDERLQLASDGTATLTKYGGQVYAKWERMDHGRLKFNGGMFGNTIADVYKIDLNGDDLTLKGAAGLETKYKRVVKWTKDLAATSSP
jgi:hypothetical protein